MTSIGSPSIISLSSFAPTDVGTSDYDFASVAESFSRPDTPVQRTGSPSTVVLDNESYIGTISMISSLPVSVVPALQPTQSAPAQQGFRCHLVAHGPNCQPMRVGVDSPWGTTIFLGRKAHKDTLEWIITPSGTSYTIQHLATSKYMGINPLSDSEPYLQNHPTLWDFIEIQEPCICTRDTSKAKGERLCIVRPAGYDNLLLKTSALSLRVLGRPSQHNEKLKKRWKWHVTFLDDATTTTGPPPPKIPQSAEPRVVSAPMPMVSQDTVVAATVSNITRKPTTDGRKSIQNLRENSVDEAACGTHTVRIQHVLTAKYLATQGPVTKLSDSPTEWTLERAGAGYTLSMESSDGPFYLAPPSSNVNSERRNLSLSTFPAPWDLSSHYGNQDPTFEAAEWICQLRWAFSDQCILADLMPSRVTMPVKVSGTFNSLVWLDAHGNDPVGLHVYWRVQFLRRG